MKIIAFEVRNDELESFKKTEMEYQVEITYVCDALTKENAHLLEGFEYVSILGFSKLDKDLIDRMKVYGVKAVSTRTIGYNHIDVDYATKAGIVISNANYAPNGVADYTIMLILMAMRNYKQALFRGNVNDYSLAGLQGREMRNMTIGIVGAGSIGAAVIRNLQGFGCEVLAYAGHPKKELEGMCTFASMDEIYERCDIISFHAPLTKDTYHMVNEETLAKMKDGVILINTARGSLMELSTLIKGIETKKIGALGLDVIEYEEGLYHRDLRSDIISNRDIAYLRQFPNVTMTQHMAFYTKEAVESMVRCGVENLWECEKKGDCSLRIA
ncbi:MAG: lactate dehydrogenase [Lachnospiraceae bacterium]|nr:lactate dehydrogenase [Lachnospiraceae bacterium]